MSHFGDGLPHFAAYVRHTRLQKTTDRRGIGHADRETADRVSVVRFAPVREPPGVYVERAHTAHLLPAHTARSSRNQVAQVIKITLSATVPHFEVTRCGHSVVQRSGRVNRFRVRSQPCARQAHNSTHYVGILINSRRTSTTRAERRRLRQNRTIAPSRMRKITERIDEIFSSPATGCHGSTPAGTRESRRHRVTDSV
ncbi:hypothetical protein PAN31117_03256 [Pandoraea anapnoica]|uniref:Uncharacterized protein n=1 Tax=Pandoraea anapnoica TaxID=2508301 RepID=A0A5E5A9I1_9BURK|nr:hypothetical protein PAN31117_03256 [Pandoraea anapnoica]